MFIRILFIIKKTNKPQEMEKIQCVTQKYIHISKCHHFISSIEQHKILTNNADFKSTGI